MTELSWRNGPIRVLATDFVAMGDSLPRTAGGTLSPGQYIKRFRMINEGTEPRRALFGVYIQTEVNGGIGDPGLSWHDGDLTLLATNRGHGHVNRKLAARIRRSSSRSRSTAGATCSASRPARMRRSCSAGSTCRLVRR